MERDEKNAQGILLRKALRDAGLSGYRLNWDKAPGKPDIAFPKYKIALILSEECWRYCVNCDFPLRKEDVESFTEDDKATLEKERKRTFELERAGWKVFVFRRKEVEDNARGCAERVKRYIVANQE